MESVATWSDGLKFEGIFSTGHSIMMDTSEVQGGTDRGPRPVELLLMSLAGCTGMDVLAILKKKRMKITSFNVRVVGEREENHPRVFNRLHVVYDIAGEGIDDNAVRQAIVLSQDKYCSISAMLRKAAALTSEVRIHREDR
jgi:putative redox protein